MNAGLTNSDGCSEKPATDNQRRAPLISTPANTVITSNIKATANIGNANRRTWRGVKSDARNNTLTATGRTNIWRLTN